jgi:hypothetical protein
MVTRIYAYMAGLIAAGIIIATFVPAETLAQSGGTRVRSATTHSVSRSSSRAAHSKRLTRSHHNKLGIGFPWIGPGDVYYNIPSNDERQNVPSDISVNLPPLNTQTEISVRNSNPGYYTFYPIHLGCAQEAVTVPWNDGTPHTVTVVRC